MTTSVVLALRFVSELALVGGAAWAASTQPRAVVVAVAAGILAALAVAAMWSVAIAPASRLRLSDPLRLVLEIVLFAAVALGLAAVGHVPAAVVLFVGGPVTAVGVRLVHAEDPTGQPTGERKDERTDDVPASAAGAQLRRPRGPGRARRPR